MTLNTQILKTTLENKKYKWFDSINLIGVRTTLQVPDVFNDYMCLVWKQKTMPSGLSNTDTQAWLNSNLFYGKDGKPLILDGGLGTNSKFALEQYNSTLNKERLKTYTITTDPGLYWLNYPMSNLGTAVLIPAQNINCWALGFHQWKPDHEALVQQGTVKVYRDNDKDNVAEVSPTQEAGNFGINIHGSNKSGVTPTIGKWSAGCQVFNEWGKKEEFVSICKQFKTELQNKFTYTLIEEKDLEQ